MFHVKHSGHFSFLFEPIIFPTTDADNFRGKLFHVKHSGKSAANGVRLYFLCRQFTLTMPRHYLFRRLSSYIARLPSTKKCKATTCHDRPNGGFLNRSTCRPATSETKTHKNAQLRRGRKIPTDRSTRPHRSCDAKSRVQNATHLMRHT